MTSSPNREIGSELVGSLDQSTGSYELVLGAVVAALVGFGIDSLVGTGPIFTATFAGLGLVAAAVSVIYGYRARMTVATGQRDARRNQDIGE